MERNTSAEEHVCRDLADDTWLVRCYCRIGSTMDGARALIPELSGDRCGLVMADVQTAGRGRLGRKWEESSGSLYVTYILPLKCDLQRMSGFSLVLGLVFSDLLSDLGADVELKWPNDLMTAEGKKLGGILTEIVPGDGISYVLAGVGINVAGVPEELSATGASLTDLTDRHLTAPQLAAGAAKLIGRTFPEFIEKGFVFFKERWLERAVFYGKEIKVTSGTEKITGIFKGLSDSGVIELETVSGIVEVAAGDIHG